MPQTKYNTNLAAEFFVLSMLHRLGVNCQLTIGNKKAVDIVIESNRGKLITVDVKGLAGTTIWPLDNFATKKPSHFLVFVCFLGKIDQYDILPEVYVLRSTSVDRYLYRNPGGTRKGIQLSTLRRDGKKYLNNWRPLQR